ncbi:c-type cytochrome [Dyadobacter arcticus]|uniref:Mono/diheme cytochrome c family protein n=1 Tax=Dyadobacter arcticus TaxID=1078754 RepID=A0ABX0UN39_9BACT|nr:cytochrome c [Dyadobacter arcticus]NIJ53070.1 mono/diheme cytochrome c family protein [Dyadobacter arcticus]
MRRNKLFAASIIIFSGVGLAGFSPEIMPVHHSIQDPWKAPAWADTLKSPYHEEPLTLAQGEELFTLYCASCHGDEGYGDGAAGGALGQKPANFHDTLVKVQSDGALFWKISTGRGNMPPFKDVFSDEQRWQLVAYIRHLGKTD